MEMERALFDQDLFSLDKHNNVIHLETSLFELGSSPKGVSGVFYMLLIYSNIFSTYLFYQRYLETGNYKGFLPTVLQFLKQHYNLPDSNILPWQIYTPKDVQLQSAKTSTYMSGNPLSHTHCK